MPEKAKKTPRAAFAIPSIEDIQALMKEKKTDWPETFCEFYATKFWHHYNKQDWHLSAGKGGKMKVWQSAFYAQWQDLTHESDRKKLQTLQASETARQAKEIGKGQVLVGDIGAEAVDGLLKEYLCHPTHISNDRLAACYGWIKDNMKPKLSREQTGIVKEMANTDMVKAKATVVGWVFEAVSNKGQTFKQLLHV